LLIQDYVNEHARAANNFRFALKGSPVAVTVGKSDAGPGLAAIPSPTQEKPMAAGAIASEVSSPQAAAGLEAFYEVKPGDTLISIARRHQTTVKALKAANGLTSDMIVAGIRLKLPSA
jgi:hypothetical protein